jgi:hypothetical protein
MQEFAAMSLNLTNDIDYASYFLLPSVLSAHVEDLDPMVFAALPEQFNTVLDSACTNHIIHD